MQNSFSQERLHTKTRFETEPRELGNGLLWPPAPILTKQLGQFIFCLYLSLPSPPHSQHNGDGRPSNANVGYAHDSNTGGRGRGYKDREDQVYQLHFDQVSQEILTRTVGCEKKDNVPNGV